MTFDIGFGDVITPSSVDIDYPLLLPDVPGINIQAYSLETVVAEKFHTMIDRDILNSRMKDFFDCYLILSTQNIDDAMLYEAVKATFDNRQLRFNSNLQLFSEAFPHDTMRMARWKSFLRKIKWKDQLDFSQVMALVNQRLKPLYEQYWTEQGNL